MHSRIINVFIKILILAGLLYAIYNQLFVNNNIHQIINDFINQFTITTLLLLIIPLALVFVNWGIEAVKWKYILKKEEMISYKNAFKGIFSGVTLGLFTPNRVGEYGGRILFLQKGNKINGIILSIISSYGQITATFLVGILGLTYFFFTTYPIDKVYFNYLIIGMTVILIFLILTVYFNIHLLGFIFDKVKWLRKAKKHIYVIKSIEYRQLLVVLGLSIARYLVYSVQFLALLWILGVNASPLKGLTMISIIFLCQTIIPTIALTELGVRGNLSVFFMGFITENLLAVVSASVVLWMINLVIPALLGLSFMYKFNFYAFTKSYKKWMPKLLILACIFSTAALKAEDNEACLVENKSFKIGEELTYQVSYNWGLIWANAGEVTFKVEEETMNNKSVYHFSGVGQTYPDYDWFFKVRDRYESYVDRTTLLPYKFARDVKEGGYEKYSEITFDRENNQATTRKGVFDFPDCTHDVLSIVYKSRNIDFSNYKEGDIIPLTIFLDHQVHPIHIRYLGKENLKTKLGKFDCIKFKPLLIEGTLFEEGENMTVWVTDDNNKIPIRVESPIVVGSVKVDLISYENLRSNFTAKLK